MNLGQILLAFDRRSGLALDRPLKVDLANEAVQWVSSADSWPWLLASTSVTPVADQRTYTLPAGVDDVDQVFVNGVAVEAVSPRDLRATTPVVDAGWAVDGERTLRLWPTPSATTTSITVYYRAEETTLVADPDELLMPDKWLNTIVHRMCALAWERAGDRKKVEFYASRAEAWVKMMEKAAKHTQRSPVLPRIRPW